MFNRGNYKEPMFCKVSQPSIGTHKRQGFGFLELASRCASDMNRMDKKMKHIPRGIVKTRSSLLLTCAFAMISQFLLSERRITKAGNFTIKSSSSAFARHCTLYRG
ncbi:uncharacterized protein BDCG_16858 [Blastomyces dermatitidis ER-3]|uniref:Uncharacterized protein n=3 Tax=Blastomyces TaxID=229219 RepID=A0A179U9D7_BLAGS|nr:uncharacterized protein BDBG_16297 [Blastomyces gilchristii SLH14081]XP_045280752.1 uncharacterized protein BDCG_16858 [Blastomyces dermatitidis ER-3]KMW68048.1 hypothetical protein BDDG_12543 [Blastomyces dermatitidis ATCC 18188]OAT01025.1 hypothetical protein BDCG_16858 [Blastomyces dermatitidis ER-3]OAT04594.1 hypothetical protein BDBG_16297 [Blastomyces gilchristii SLH14081]